MKKLLTLSPVLRKFIVGGLFTFPFTFTLSSQTTTDLANDNIKGKVKMVKQEYHQVLQTKAGKDSIGQEWEGVDRTFVMAYNEQGNISWATFYKIGSTLD
ncbi:MAG TPA: hypothetical protein VL651_13100, partial [Bacteroidia bacterium]|nr:hypothetical protein [Bacteroidia bacterium]